MLTLTRHAGIGGEVKREPEDFIVKEITRHGITLEQGRKYTAEEVKEEEVAGGRFTTFVMEKKNWETIRAILEIGKRVGKGRKSISYAGTKDKRSVSVQLAAVYGVEPANLKAVSIKDISINGAWKSNGIELGSNLGNSFTITIKNATQTENIKAIIEESNNLFPNYFDKQRFGYRLNNAKIGLSILNDNPEEASMAFLTDTSNENDQESSEARKRLLSEMDFQKALDYFPRHLKYERTMIDHLAKYKNYANAIRKMPRGISIMFIHAVEDLIFNAALEERIKANDFKTGIYCKKNFYGFPDLENVMSNDKNSFALGSLIGYETKEEEISEYEREVIEKLGIEKEIFKIKSIPELSMKGARRPLLSPFKNFSYSGSGENVNLNFAIPAGSYATLFLGEITKIQGMELKDLF